MTSALHQAASLAGNLPGLLLEAQRAAEIVMRGQHGLRKAGAGEAFWQFRNWQPGDSSRDIDWRQTGRRDEVFVRQTERESAQVLWLFRDGSGSMNYKSKAGLHTKKDYAEILLLALALLTQDAGEKAGLLGGEAVSQIHRICEALPLQTHMTEAGGPVPSHSRVVMFSDFYFPVEELAAFCEKLALRRVEGLLVQVCDPVELSFNFQGRVKFIDVETPDTTTIPRVESLHEAYAAKFQEHKAALEKSAAEWGWGFQACSTDMPPEAALLSLYERLGVK